MVSTVERLRKRRQLGGFFFLRKPPGLSLRFALPAPRGGALREIEACLKHLALRRAVGRWVPGVYEPETFKFGGPEAMKAVHLYFFADSKACLRWEQLRHRAGTRMGGRLLSSCVLNDLFQRCLDGPEEVWDVWCRVAALHGAPVASDGPAASAVGIDDVIGGVGRAEAAILREYARSNRTIARRFQAIQARGKLLYAHRLVLPHVALYHWNRYGLTPHDRATIFTAMMRAWSPNA